MATRMEKRREKQVRNRRSFRRFLLEMVLVIGVALLIRTFVFCLTRVDGPSMEDTLHTGQLVAVEKVSCRLGKIERGQVVICRYPNSEDYYIKRVIALGGDTLEIRGGVTYLNGEALEEEYVTHAATQDFGPVTVEEGRVFVMGDNRANSHDSRAEGALEEKDITGHALCVVFPINQLKKLSLPQQD